MADIVILGAGLTGISAAYHLQARGFSDYKLFEKESTPGGLCRSISIDGFTFDFTGHLLHTSDAYFRALITQHIGLENFNIINRKSFIYSHQVFSRYPFQINLFGLPSSVIIECIEGYIQKSPKRKHAKNFISWVQQQFGSGFAKHFFLPFQEKIFSYPLHKITASWTGRFVPQTSLKEMLYGALQDNAENSTGYNAQFYYPKQGGIQYWVNALKNTLTHPIATDHQVIRINMHDKKIYFKNGHEESYKQLISTIPLNTFINLLDESPSTTFYRAKYHLKCNSVINFNLGIKREDLTEKHWIYFPESTYPFYRIGFPHNFSSQTVPPGCSSLYGEFSYLSHTPKQKNERLKASLIKVKELLHLQDHEIIVEKIIDIPHAYVIYNHWREKHLETLLQQLTNHQIYSIGRYGAWKYSSMQEAVLDGKHIAEQLTIIPAQKIDAFDFMHEQPKNTQEIKHV